MSILSLLLAIAGGIALAFLGLGFAAFVGTGLLLSSLFCKRHGMPLATCSECGGCGGNCWRCGGAGRRCADCAREGS